MKMIISYITVPKNDDLPNFTLELSGAVRSIKNSFAHRRWENEVVGQKPTLERYDLERPPDTIIFSK